MLRRELGELRSALEQRLGELREIQLGNGAGYSTVTVARLPMVVAARALIADACATLPLVDVRDGQLVTPTPSILLRPDPAMSRRRFVHRAAMSLTGWGNLYLGVTRWLETGWPLATEVLRPDALAPIYDTDGYTVLGWTYGGGYQLDAGSVIHVPLWELDLEQIARSPLADCQQAFDDLAVLWGFATGYWRDGGLPPYVLTHPSRLQPGQAEELIEQWISARLTRRPGLLSGNITLQPFSTPSAADALLLDGLAYIDQTVARVFGITPSLLNVRAEMGSLTYNNTRDEVVRWLNLSLYPTWLARLEDAFTAMLPRGQQAMFDTSSLGVLGLTRPGADEGAATPPPLEPAPMPAATGNGAAP